MRRHSIVSLLILLTSFSVAVQTEASQFFRNCKPLSGSACGACEQTLSDRMDAYFQAISQKATGTTEGIIKDLKNIISEESVTLGAKQLNWFVAPYSRSLIKPTPEFPKIIIKSPNAEVWMAYGTDPTNEHFESVELMRWVPGKSKFEFTLIERNPENGKVTVDRSGSKCIECHTSRLRPVWDSYKAWPGLAPARDDLLETDPRNTAKLEPLSDYYLTFLEKIKQIRSPDDRLSGLASPFGAMTVMQIKENQLKQSGYLRIPHFPDPQYNRNFSKKTAKFAGPSHLAFDQLETLNLCSAADEIRQKALGTLLLSQFAMAASWRSLAQPDSKSACIQLKAGADCMGEIDNNIQFKKNADQSNTEDRIAKQRATYLSLQKAGMNISDGDIDYWSKEVKRTLPAGLSVISDRGGVLPVAEADRTSIAVFQYLLKNTRINIESWSMSDAPLEGAINSRIRMSFSDQFNSILTKIDWSSFAVPSVGSIPIFFPNLVEGEMKEQGSILFGDGNNASLSVVPIRDDLFSAFGQEGELLARVVLIPDSSNALDNPTLTLKVEGEKAMTLSEWLNKKLTANVSPFGAFSNTICKDSVACYVLLAKGPMEEFRDSRRLEAVLRGPK